MTFRRRDSGQPLHAGHGDGGNELYLTVGSASAYRFDLEEVPEIRRLPHPACGQPNS